MAGKSKKSWDDRIVDLEDRTDAIVRLVVAGQEHLLTRAQIAALILIPQSHARIGETLNVAGLARKLALLPKPERGRPVNKGEVERRLVEALSAFQDEEGDKRNIKIPESLNNIVERTQSEGVGRLVCDFLSKNSWLVKIMRPGDRKQIEKWMADKFDVKL